MRETAYLWLQSRITTGKLPAGVALSEVSIAKEIGCSRTPLREAIGQLVAEGYLTQIPSRGTLVTEFTSRDIGELYDLREALEVYAVGRLAQQGVRPADLQALRSLLTEHLQLERVLADSGRLCLSNEEMRRFTAVDLRFHSLLLHCAGNSRILKVMSDTRLLISIFNMRRKGHDVRQLKGIHGSHSGILESVERGDQQMAMHLISEHIRISKMERLREYDEWDRETSLNRVLPDSRALALPDVGLRRD